VATPDDRLKAQEAENTAFAAFTGFHPARREICQATTKTVLMVLLVRHMGLWENQGRFKPLPRSSRRDRFLDSFNFFRTPVGHETLDKKRPIRRLA
jgi:hypothetical protein